MTKLEIAQELEGISGRLKILTEKLVALERKERAEKYMEISPEPTHSVKEPADEYYDAVDRLNRTNWNEHSVRDYKDYQMLKGHIIRLMKAVGRTSVPLLHPEPNWKITESQRE